MMEPARPVNWDQRIREIHSKLSTVWNAVRNRWEIHYDSDRGFGPQLAIVVGDGVRYQPLDDRVLQTLRAGDTHNIGPREVAKIMEDSENAYLEAKQREQDNMTDAISREMADHTRIIQKPIGIATQKEVAHKASTPSSSDESVVSDN